MKKLNTDTFVEIFDEKTDQSVFFFKNIREKTEMFDLLPKIKADLSDLLDLAKKFQDIKGLVIKSYEKKILTQDEIDSIIDQIVVAQKTIGYFLEEKTNYSDEISFLGQFCDQLSQTVEIWNYAINLHVGFGYTYPEIVLKEGWIINDNIFTILEEYLKKYLILIPFDQSKIQNDLDRIIQSILLIIATIEKQLIRDIGYVKKPLIIDQFYSYFVKLDKIRSLFDKMITWKYFSNLLPMIITDLTSLRQKALKSKEGTIGITSWGATRLELTHLNELLGMI